MHVAAALLPILLSGFVSHATAAPKLRLSSVAVGPISITQGSNGPTQTIEASNAGDGNLSLSAVSSSPWVITSVGASRPCSLQDGICVPVSFSFATSSLARGTYTAAVTINDPNALDAPQVVTVTVAIGGSVPDSVSLYIAPNGSPDDVKFSTNSQLLASATTTSGGPWLSLAIDGSGSFRFVVPYRISARYLDGMGEGTYNGSVAISGSSVPAENKTVPVQLVVTSQPIARVSPTSLSLRLSTNAPSLQTSLTVFNGGLGTLNVTGASTSVASGAGWLSASADGGGRVTVSTNPSGLAVGSYTGTVTINSNAANSSLVVPVQLAVVAQTAPLAPANSVVNAGNSDNALAQGGMTTVLGEQFSSQAPAQSTDNPLAQTVGGVRVLVNDQAAPLYSSSYGQVNFQIPYETPTGDAIVRVERDGQPGNAVTVQVAARAPRILQRGDYGVIANMDGSLATVRPSKPGETVTIYAVGLGATNPIAATGTAAPMNEPLARTASKPRVVFGNAFSGVISLDPVYAGLVPNTVGLYQVTVVLPTDVPVGDLPISLEGDDFRSNTVLLPIRN